MDYKMKMIPVVLTAMTEEEAHEQLKEILQDDERWKALFKACSRVDNGDEFFYDTCSVDTTAGRLETWADQDTGIVGIQLVPNPETGDPINIAMAECNQYSLNPKDVKVSIFEDLQDEDPTRQFTLDGEKALDMVTYVYEKE